MFWDDAALDGFIRSKYPAYYNRTWSIMHPLIKKLDTSRYMLMHHYGGVSTCVYALNPADMLVLHVGWTRFVAFGF